MNTIYLSALLIGLASNFHCIGMCGPIALAIPLDRTSNRKIIQGIFVYNFGRIATYALLGSIIGIIGVSIKKISFVLSPSPPLSIGFICLISFIIGTKDSYAFQVNVFRFVGVLGPFCSHGHIFDFVKKLKDDPTKLMVLGNGYQKKAYVHVMDLINGMDLTFRLQMMSIMSSKNTLKEFLQSTVLHT